jgi:hypothetical protein
MKGLTKSWKGWTKLTIPGVGGGWELGKIQKEKTRLGSILYQANLCFCKCLEYLLLAHWISLQIIYCFKSTVSAYDDGNRTLNIGVYTWRFSTLSYNRHPISTACIEMKING